MLVCILLCTLSNHLRRKKKNKPPVADNLSLCAFCKQPCNPRNQSHASCKFKTMMCKFLNNITLPINRGADGLFHCPLDDCDFSHVNGDQMTVCPHTLLVPFPDADIFKAHTAQHPAPGQRRLYSAALAQPLGSAAVNPLTHCISDILTFNTTRFARHPSRPPLYHVPPPHGPPPRPWRI